MEASAVCPPERIEAPPKVAKQCTGASDPEGGPPNIVLEPWALTVNPPDADFQKHQTFTKDSSLKAWRISFSRNFHHSIVGFRLVSPVALRISFSRSFHHGIVYIDKRYVLDKDVVFIGALISKMPL